jgi:hypothetical protein
LAGSLKWFSYQLDGGTNVGVFLDESNTEVINGGVAASPPAGQRPTLTRPVGTKLRQIIYKSADGRRTIRCVALNSTVYNGIPAALSSIPSPLPSIGGEATGNLLFWDKTPERRKQPRFGVDTGLTDGDN